MSRPFSLLAALGALLLALQADPTPRPPAQAPLPVPPATLSLVATGDVMMHADVKRAAREAEGGMASLWAEVKPLLAAADIAFANLETPIAPRTGRPGVPYVFNATEDLPTALKESGFSILSTANNHAFDQGRKGVLETLERLEAEGIAVCGSGRDRTRAEAPVLVERNGIKLAFLAFTDIFNTDLNRKSDGPWVSSLDPERAVEAVRAARARADAVVVSLHWGSEDSHAPTAHQRSVAAAIVEAGASLILGHHPHVLQPVEWIERNGNRAVVAYSLGNFISNQNRVYRPSAPIAAGDERDGALLRVLFRRSGPHSVEIADLDVEPLWTENNWTDRATGTSKKCEIRVIPVRKTEERLWRAADASDARGCERLRTLLLRRRRIAETLGMPSLR